MPISPTEGAKAIHRVLAIGAVFLALIVFAGLGLFALTSRALLELQIRGEQSLVSAALERSLKSMVGDVTSATVWDQAYESVRPGVDRTWTDEEIGVYFARNRGHDLSVAFDAADRPFAAWIDGAVADPGRLDAFLRQAAPLIARVRKQEAARDAPVRSLAPTDPNLADTASSVVEAGGVHYLVAASTVVPERPAAPRRLGRTSLVISAQRLDGPLMNAVRASGVSDLRIGESASEASLPMRDAAGRPIGFLAWTPRHPAVTVIQLAAPGLAVGLLALGGVGLLLLRYIRAIAADITAHELALKRAMSELAEARDNAEAGSRAKSQFLANMSHEIRTPLNGILGMAHVLARGPLSTENLGHVQLIQSSGELLLNVLNDVLDISKIEAGRMELDLADFDLQTTVSAAMAPFAALAGQKGIAFEVEVAPEALGLWRGDPTRLRQVLANLASNAVKFTADGGVRVVARSAPRGLRFRVQDTGIGVDEARLPHLFDKFEQADGSTTRRYGGTGLGLTICRELVQLMGGTIAASSQPGRGSVFEFDIPSTRSAEPPPAFQRLPKASPGGLDGLRILAAEDNAVNQLLLKALLEPEGAQVEAVCDGQEALEVIERGTFDIILMDIQMPRLGGLEATAEIRRLEALTGRARTPILALTASVMPEQVREYQTIGLDGVVAKPVDPDHLADAIRAACAASTQPALKRA